MSPYDLNLEDGKHRLARFIEFVLAEFAEDRETIIWLIRRLKSLQTPANLAGEIVTNTNSAIDHQHEFRINDADLKLKLRVNTDGFVRGHVTCEYESTKAAKTTIANLLEYHGILDID